MPRYITDTVAGFQNTERQNAERPELQNSRAHPPTAPPPKGGQGESQIHYVYLLYRGAAVGSVRGAFPLPILSFPILLCSALHSVSDPISPLMR